MNKHKLVAVIILLSGIVLLVLQFILTFGRPIALIALQPTHGRSDIVLSFAPYALLLSGVYLLLRQRGTPGMNSKVGHALLVMATAWGAAGATFLIAASLTFILGDVHMVESMFSNVIVVVVLLTAAFLPVTYSRLR